VPVDPNSLPHDPAILKQMLVDLTTQLDKTQRLLAQLLAAKSGTRSEQLSADQLRLFAQELNVPKAPTEAENDSKQDDDFPPGSGSRSGDEEEARPRGRRPLPSHLKRERSFMIWPNRTSIAPVVSRICGASERKLASATNTFPRSCW
jgi:hypothetical protein